MKQGKKYTSADFRRYHSGAMNGDEMHALEKAALIDPFLADALEGYAYTSDAVTDLDDLKRKLDAKKRSARVFNISRVAGNGWWRIAAMVVVIAGAVLFLVNIDRKKQDAGASNNELVVQKDFDDLSSKINDTAANVVALENNPSPEKLRKNGMAGNGKTTSPPEPESYKKIDRATESSDESIDSKILAGRASGVVTTSFDKKEILKADTAELAYIDSNYAPATSFGQQKNISPKSKEASPLIIDRANSDMLEAQLKYGQKNFDEYLKINQDSIFKSAGDSNKVDITVVFILDKKNKPSYVIVSGSNCKPCEEEAIKLLKAGPEWVGKPGMKGEVRMVWEK